MCQFWFFSYYCVVAHITFVKKNISKPSRFHKQLEKVCIPVRTHRSKYTHTQYIASCPIALCSIILPHKRWTSHFSAFLLNCLTVYATQYHRPSKLGAQYVTIHLKLSNSRLQYFVHSSLSMNQFQGIYGGMGAALVNCCYNSIQSHSPHYWSLTYNHEKLKDWPR